MTSFTNTTKNYPTGADTPIRRVITTRNPTTADNQNFILGDEWLNKSTQRWWKLCNLTSTTAKWVPWDANSTGAIETITGDSGGVVPPTLATGNLNLLGTSGQITVTGNTSTNTLTLALSGGGTAIDSFVPDSGTTVVPTAGGAVTMTGGNGIATVGGTNQLTFDMESPFTGDFSFQSTTSGDTETLTVTNTSNTASSQAQILASVAGASAGDSWNQWTIGSVASYALGLDNSDSDKLKLNYSASASVDPSSGTNVVTYDPSAKTWTENVSNFVVQDTIGAGGPQISLNNSSSAANAGARFTIGTSSTTGDLYTLYDGPGGSAEAFEVGFQASTLSWIIQVNPTNSVPNMDGTTAFKVASTGTVIEPLQPAFFAYLSTTATNKTGNGASYTLGADALTEVYDQGSNFNTNGTFTAPVTGIYDLRAQVTITGTTIATSFVISIVVAGTSARTYINTFTRSAASTDQSVLISTLAKMTATDTATVTIVAAGEGGDTDDILGAATAQTYFCGTLAC